VVTKYVDGIKQNDWTANQGLDDPRRALQSTAVLFGDGDQDERRRMWVSSIQIRPVKLSDAELASLGLPTTNGIPVALTLPVPPQPPTLIVSRTGASLQISWDSTASNYVLESTVDLAKPAWAAVSGVSNNSVAIAIGNTQQFYRLRR
jgi:hypothetical protein